ncbi:hypothetical protein GSI_10137 [Ganoderma sinense ZZ0214-1]|uniref:F-box domain-containing protein n=1 Tax=Ganoderma sinense ZZ0214-1 TaxID=1077348 RepID=A0A2G8S0C1_9APHY|nr:hypothetical protein GSI_10137 [Ganoderma sinense ZZ0214-1]
MGRFQAALVRSSPESLVLSVPYSNQVIIDILMPHASRLSSFTLAHCAISSSLTALSVRALRILHSALEWFPNLETLSLTWTLSLGAHGRYRGLPALTKTVHLPRLRHIEIEDKSSYISHFLSHLSFPATTSLALEPSYGRSSRHWPTTVPLFPGINPSPPAPTAELSLHLDFRGPRDDDRARWETRCDGHSARAVRVTLRRGAVSDAPTVCRFTRQLVDALAPAPAPGVTSLTVEGPFCDREYWEALLPDLPGLRHLACAGGDATKDIAGVLGTRLLSSQSGGFFPCARLEELVVGWDLPLGIDLGPEEVEWQALQRWVFVPARSVLDAWQVALVEQWLRHALGDLVGDIAVAGEICTAAVPSYYLRGISAIMHE